MPMVNEYTIPNIEVSRNAFVKNHSWKGTCDTGILYPIFFDEVLPGDTKELNSTIFGRLSTPAVPVLDNIYADIHYFFVPNRLVWDNWQKFMGERKNPSDSIDYLVPTINSGESGFKRGGLIDCFSVPPAVKNLTCSSLIFYLRAYNLIWNEWYRSEILQDSVTVPTGDNGDSEDIYKLLPRGKRQDYFTSSFPETQKGNASSVQIVNGTISGLNLVGNGPMLYSNINAGQSIGFASNSKSTGGANQNYLHGIVTSALYDSSLTGNTQTKNSISGSYSNPNNNSSGFNEIPQQFFSYQSGIDVDSSNAFVNINPITINSLRQAIAVQQFLERDMFSGTRYVELLLSHYGVVCPDFRLQRPEYLGGSTTRVNISPIAQTSSSDNTSPQGNLAAIGTLGSTGSGFVHSFTEHGVVIGLLSFRTDINYQQGVDRHFLRNTRYDYFFPTLAHLGMQAIYNKEIFAQGDSVTDENGQIVDNLPFAYNMRNSEYRFKNSYITGKFRSSDPQSLDVWHLAENFENLPVLNDEFITVDDTVKRVIAVQDEPEFLVDVWNEYTDIKEVPMYGMPGLQRI